MAIQLKLNIFIVTWLDPVSRLPSEQRVVDQIEWKSNINGARKAENV